MTKIQTKSITITTRSMHRCTSAHQCRCVVACWDG